MVEYNIDHYFFLQWEDMLLVRRYGYNTELIIDRKSEQNNIKLIHAMGLGAPLHAVLNNALVYGFIQGETTDTQSIRFPEVRELVAKEMAKLHSADLSKHPGKALFLGAYNINILCLPDSIIDIKII